VNNFSKHAGRRARDRNVPPVVFDWLYKFGELTYDEHGAVILHFSHASRRQMEKALGRRFVAENRRYLNCYAVESSADGKVITAGRRYRRIPRR
jgi:hypothetical protein